MDRYMRVKKIGEGAFGKAILVKSKENGKQCVIKEISLGRMGPKEREDSRKEVAVLAQLNHPNIVTYLESFEEKGTLYICMDYCAGGDLYSKINQQRGALMTEEQIWSYFAQICLAIKHIHDRKILHRDIKSQNIFLTGEGRVKIGDFGIAKVLNSTMELARTCIGTPYYLSPELVENLPYNNKSDVWSLGCVLYEMTTLKHAFEAGNMKNLVLKIIRGVYPPIPPKYSYELRGIIAQLFKRSPRDRPSINSLLRKNIMMQKVRNLLSDDKLAEEFSHTIMHGKKIARALPPPPRPGSARPASANSRPGSAAKRSVSKPAQSNSKYNPANIYGQPLVKKSNEKRSGVDVKKKSGAGRIVPGQADWEKKRIELREREKQRRDEEKQKIAQINRSREAGWNNLLDPPPTPKQPEVEVRQPPPQRAPLVVPRKPEFRIGGDKGNYEHYNAYLDKMQQDRINRIREGGPVPLPRPAAIPYMQAPSEAAPPKRLGREQFQFNRGAGQGAEDRRAIAEAAERNRLAEEFLNRKKEAALNKARGQAEIYGNRPSSAGVQRAATPKLQVKPGAAVSARNREEQDYLSQLRKIREQNMRERKMLQGKKDPDNADLGKYKPPLDEDRRKKIEALKKQADDWANRNKEESEKAKKDLIALRRNLEDQAKSRPPSRNVQSRPGSANKKPVVVMKPAAAVPITGVLQAIGATDDNSSNPTPDNKEATRQQQKENILKRLNEKQNPGRSKWVNPDGTFIPAFGGGDDEEVASSARSQWEEGQQVKLSDLPLEQTSSQMEATNAGDQVIRSPDGKIIRVSAAGGRQEWGRPGSTILNALQGLPIDGTMASTVSGGSDDSRPSEPTSPHPPINIVSGIGATITVNKPLIREGTITIKSAEESANNKDSLPVAPSLSDQNIEDIKTALSVIGELEEFSPNKETDNKTAKTGEPSDEIKSNIVQSNTEIHTTCNDNQSETSSQIDAISIKQSEITSADGESNNQPNTFTQSGAKLDDQSESTSAVNKSVPTSNDLQDSSVEKQGTRQSVAERLSNNFSKDGSTETIGKPAIPKKPQFEFKKPVLLPKPDLSAAEFAKPVIAPVVINSKGEGNLFSRVQLDDDEDFGDNKSPQADAKPEVIQEQNGKMVAKGLTTGNFDIGNVKMLRTCSEPDLSKLFETGEKNPTPPLTRHLSLDRLNTVQEEVDDDLESVKQSLSEVDIYSPRSDTSQPKSDNDNNTDDQQVENDDNGDDEDGDDEDDDDDDDIINVRATMQSLLIDDDDDDEENEHGVKVDFKLSDTSQKKCKAGDDSDGSDINIENDESENNDDGNNEIGENDDDDDDKDEKEDEKSDEDDNKGHIKHSQSDSVLSRHSSLKSDTFSDLFAGDSDGETTFGDDDNEDDEYDVYGRLEEARAELEEVLGFDLFIKVYKAIQALQEDEDENVEEGTKIALEILGKENEKHYPKIFQLVMSDTAFTEDNA
ncbi:serine/threonine-protein kinase Nek1 isoform X2 [Patella vulgata]|uniref:serine/threonine-protein kinase Nek1 isoform X2 n=1 Tax=Patella vulgata TaxID=6465 RepID=UPI0021802FA7|nr:serine/threonine-protein kinase Nek1 isoform X2 [Patella vulgata]